MRFQMSYKPYIRSTTRYGKLSIVSGIGTLMVLVRLLFQKHFRDFLKSKHKDWSRQVIGWKGESKSVLIKSIEREKERLLQP